MAAYCGIPSEHNQPSSEHNQPVPGSNYAFGDGSNYALGVAQYHNPYHGSIHSEQYTGQHGTNYANGLIGNIHPSADERHPSHVNLIPILFR